MVDPPKTGYEKDLRENGPKAQSHEGRFVSSVTQKVDAYFLREFRSFNF